ncbi:Amidase, partial [Metarhizium hybridum]
MGFAASIDVLTADIKGLQSLLGQGHVTSRSLVESYLAQIDKHDGYLHAMIQITPTHLLSERAGQMDRERRAGSIRGPLHGIPIIIKASVLGQSCLRLLSGMLLTLLSLEDSIATHPSLGLGTTAGSLSLQGSKPRKSATVVEKVSPHNPL